MCVFDITRFILTPQWQLLDKFKINCNEVAHIWHSYLYLLTYQLQVALHDITVVSLLGPGGPGKKEDILKLLKLASRNMFPASPGSYPTQGGLQKLHRILHIIVTFFSLTATARFSLIWCRPMLTLEMGIVALSHNNGIFRPKIAVTPTVWTTF